MRWRAAPTLVTCAIAGAVLLSAVPPAAGRPDGRKPKPPIGTPVDRAALAARVRAELLHAWRGYERYAWGHDELKPVSRAAHDWYGESAPDDAGRRARHAAPDGPDRRGREGEGADRREALLRPGHLGQELRDHDPAPRRPALRLPDDRRRAPARASPTTSGTRLLPAFDSPTGMPYMYVNLKTGQDERRALEPRRDRHARCSSSARSRSSPDKPVFFDKAQEGARSSSTTRRSKIGLVGEEIDVETGAVGRAARATSAAASTRTTSTS